MNAAQEALAGVLWECGEHARHLRNALDAMRRIEPLDAHRLESLSDDEIRIVDQFIYRYTCLQDALGQKAFKYLLEATQEPLGPAATFIDRLNVLERLGVLDASDWEITRLLRNRLVHEYSDAEKRRQDPPRGSGDGAAAAGNPRTYSKNRTGQARCIGHVIGLKEPKSAHQVWIACSR